MNYSLQLSLLFLALAPRVSAFSGTAPERLRRPFGVAASGRRSIQQPQQSRSYELFMSSSSSFDNMADDTEEVPPEFSSSSRQQQQ
jgi:hypothetical protein